MKDLRKLITLVESLNEARSCTAEEFVRLTESHFKGDLNRLRKMTLVDLQDVAKVNNVQLPTAVRYNEDYKSGSHYWNFVSENQT